MSFKEFMIYMNTICGMPLIYDGGEAIGVICCERCECGEPVYEEDWEDYFETEYK